MAWYPDRGLATLIGQWREEHPGAVVGTIGDEHHKPPSEHLPEEDGSVDAGDFMPGTGVSQADLDDLAETLRTHRDPRIAYVIRRQRIFSSTNQPWQWRPYSGAYHGHTHVSVNDRHENDTTRWAGVGRAPEPDAPEVPNMVRFQVTGQAAQYLPNGGVVPDGATAARLQAAGVPLVQVDNEADLNLLLGGDTGPVLELDYDLLAKALLRQLSEAGQSEAT